MNEDPPRPAEGSSQQQELSGYSPARGDFAIEHNNYAELDVREMTVDPDDDKLTLSKSRFDSKSKSDSLQHEYCKLSDLFIYVHVNLVTFAAVKLKVHE